jgi:CTP synthase (UTP-ammonia lyase)
VLGIEDAAHEEDTADAPRLLITRLTCSLVGTTGPVRVVPGTLAHRVYGKDEIAEEFRCRYGLNPEYRQQMAGGTLRVAGVDPDGEVRIVELAGHRFFVGTLFVPQLSSRPGEPHPLITAYLEAALQFQAAGRGALSAPPWRGGGSSR